MADVRWIIFDFDNTIADALSAWINAYNSVAPKYGCRVIGPENYDVLRGKTAWQIKKALGVPLFKAAAMRREIRQIFSSGIAQLKFHRGMDKVIPELFAKQYRLGIFSSNTRENLRQFLQNNDFHKYFEFVEPEASLFYKGWQLKRVLKKYNIDPSQAFYIGDETKDVDAAKKAGMKSAAVTWGVNSKVALLSHHPDFLAETPEQLLKIFA